jgi:hypothetical protein
MFLGEIVHARQEKQKWLAGMNFHGGLAKLICAGFRASTPHLVSSATTKPKRLRWDNTSTLS